MREGKQRAGPTDVRLYCPGQPIRAQRACLTDSWSTEGVSGFTRDLRGSEVFYNRNSISDLGSRRE